MKNKYTDKEFIRAVKNNYSISKTLKELKLKPSGGNYKVFYKKVKELNISINHFTGQAHLKNKKHDWNVKIPLTKILIKESNYSSTYHLKKRLIKEKIFQYKCNICGIDDWNHKPLSLHLDHINGINNDNRIENLQLLCPNCHSQTSTYTGKNIKKKYFTNKCIDCDKLIKSNRVYCEKCFMSKQYKEHKTVKNIKLKSKCLNCHKSIHTQSNYCKDCYKQPTKIEWPSENELKEMVWKIPRTTLAKHLGVSDKAIAKRCKHFNISMPPRGYWSTFQPF